MTQRLSRLQGQTLRSLLQHDPDWRAVTGGTADALWRRGLVEVRTTPSGWSECRLTPEGRELASGHLR